MTEKKEETQKRWRNGVYLATAKNSLQADIWESKLKGEGIPVERKYKGSSNYMEIFMGRDLAFPIEFYVPEECLEDAQNIIVPVPLDEEFEEWKECASEEEETEAPE